MVGEPAGDRGGGCLNPLDPQSKRLFTPDGPFHTVDAMNGGGGRLDGVCIDAIALDGDKLKPREDQRKGGNGFGVNEEGAGYTLTGVDRHGVAYCANGVTLDAKNGFPVADGVSQSLIGGTAPGHKNAVVSTNSNGEDVAATLTQDLAKQTGAQQANGGGTSSPAARILP